MVNLEDTIPFTNITLMQLIVAIVILIVGWIAIRIAKGLLGRSLTRSKIPPLVVELMTRLLGVLLWVAVILFAVGALGFDSTAVSRYLRNTLDIEQEANARAAIRLEVNQENAVSELSSQLNEYTANYNAAMDRGDERAAAVWSRNRIDLLKEMLRVTGLYDKARREAEGDNEIIIKVDWI